MKLGPNEVDEFLVFNTSIPSQLTTNVVTTLSKGCILVSLDCTLLQRRSDVANVANVISCLVVVIIRFVDVVWIRCHNVFP